MWCRRARLLSSLQSRRGIATDRVNGVPDRIGGVAPAVQFKRYYDAPTMDANAVVRTLRELVAEKSCDVFLFQALAQRFYERAEEFFPPQIDAVLNSFAELNFFSESLLDGYVGRLDDIIVAPSPRRLVRLLRNGTALRLEPEACIAPLLPQLHRHVPNLHHGLPSVLASLHAVRWHDSNLIELLLTQGLLVANDAGDGFFSRIFERWSRHGFSNSEAELRAMTLANKSVPDFTTKDTKVESCIPWPKECLDPRDCLNLLAGLLRCGHHSEAEALEERLVAQLRVSPTETVVDVLTWMRRLSLRGPRLWLACGDSVELALKQRKFIRDDLPDAIHSLAALSDGSETEATFLARLFNAPETHSAIGKYHGTQVFRLLHAACLVGVSAKPEIISDKSWRLLTLQVTRLSRQLALPERRRLRTALEFLQDLNSRYNFELGECLSKIRSLPVFTLPPLLGEPHNGEIEWTTVDVGAERLLRPTNEEGNGGRQMQGIRFLGFGDTFATPVLTQKKGSFDTIMSTPACRLSLQALKLQGWTIEVRT